MDPNYWLLPPDEASEWGYGNAPLPSERTLVENAGAPAKETEFWPTSELEWSQRVDETGNYGVIQFPGTQIVSDPADFQRPDISGNTMMQPNYIQQDGVRDIGGLQSTTPGSHPSSSSTSATRYTFPNEPTFPSIHPSSSGTGAMPYPGFLHKSSTLLFKPVDLDQELILKLVNAYSTDDFSSYSPKKNKTKPLNLDGGNGSKRCNCKKSMCLKLYCECFAVGVYCSDSCGCQGCSNRIEHKDIVLETAKKVKTQNLQAFSKKTTEFSTNNSGEDGFHHKPRHKTGCTCKKSRCLQKYCECCQFGVGCSDRCRCEGCQNSYGKKEDYSMNRIHVSKNDDNDNNQILYGEELRMSSSTPSIPYSNNGETAPMSSWIPHVTFQSSEPDTNTQFHYVPCLEMVTPNSNNGINQVSFDRGLEYGSQETRNNVLAEFDESALLNQLDSANVSGGQMFLRNHHLSYGNSTSGNGETAPRSSWFPHVTFQSFEPDTNIQFPSVSSLENGIKQLDGLEYGSQDTRNNVSAEFDESILLNQQNSANVDESIILNQGNSANVGESILLNQGNSANVDESILLNQRNSANVSGGQMFPSNHHLSYGYSTSGYNSIVNPATHPERNTFLEFDSGRFCNTSNNNRLEAATPLRFGVVSHGDMPGYHSPFGITREIGSCSSAGPRKCVKTTLQHGFYISPSTPSNDFQNHDNMNPTDPRDSNRR